MSGTPPRVLLIRHGETERSITRQHTGRTDIPLTDEGRRQAERLGARLAGERFTLVLVSPLKRALETARLAGFAIGEKDSAADVEPDLVEWDYGAYDGLTATEIRRERPGWTPWEGGFPGGPGAGPDPAGRRRRGPLRPRPHPAGHHRPLAGAARRDGRPLLPGDGDGVGPRLGAGNLSYRSLERWLSPGGVTIVAGRRPWWLWVRRSTKAATITAPPT